MVVTTEDGLSKDLEALVSALPAQWFSLGTCSTSYWLEMSPLSLAVCTWQSERRTLSQAFLHPAHSGTEQMLSHGTADVVLEACTDFWDGADIYPLSGSDR